MTKPLELVLKRLSDGKEFSTLKEPYLERLSFAGRDSWADVGCYKGQHQLQNLINKKPEFRLLYAGGEVLEIVLTRFDREATEFFPAKKEAIFSSLNYYGLKNNYIDVIDFEEDQWEIDTVEYLYMAGAKARGEIDTCVYHLNKESDCALTIVVKRDGKNVEAIEIKR